MTIHTTVRQKTAWPLGMGMGRLLCLLAYCSPLRASTMVGSCHSALAQLAFAVTEFERICGRLPTQQEGLTALIQKPSDWPHEQPWEPLLIGNLPKDPWGYDYRYVLMPGRDAGFGIYSLGADGITASDGNDPDDLNTWDKNAPWLAYYKAECQERRPLVYLIPVAVAVVVGAFLFRAKQRRTGKLRPRDMG